MKRYVLGFAFSPNGDCVLIEKTKPDWQNGLVNGLGGSIEPGESPQAAMVREFHEEAGIYVTDWQYGLTIYGGNADKPVVDDWELIVFRKKLDGRPALAADCIEGRVFWASELPPNIEQTARWLYWLCRDDSTFGLQIARNYPFSAIRMREGLQ